MKTISVACALALAAASGCASITGSELQSILLSSKTKAGETVEGAECALRNDRGSWTAKTPAPVTIQRSGEDMQVECKKEGIMAGLAKLISRAHGGMAGNILFGGGIGALIDHSRGTGYEYPNNVVVIMGESTVIDRDVERAAEQQRVIEPQKPQ